MTTGPHRSRSLSLSASLTEIAFAVGAGEQVVAVDQYSTHPPEAPVTDLSGFRPNVEAIAGYEPDLVLVASNRDGIVDALAAAGIPAVLLTRRSWRGPTWPPGPPSPRPRCPSA